MDKLLPMPFGAITQRSTTQIQAFILRLELTRWIIIIDSTWLMSFINDYSYNASLMLPLGCIQGLMHLRCQIYIVWKIIASLIVVTRFAQ